MSDDLVQRLRGIANHWQLVDSTHLLNEAADRIEELESIIAENVAHDGQSMRERVTALEAALREIANYDPPKPTIEELEVLLREESNEAVHINSDGSVSHDAQAIARRALEWKS